MSLFRSEKKEVKVAVGVVANFLQDDPYLIVSVGDNKVQVLNLNIVELVGEPIVVQDDEHLSVREFDSLFAFNQATASDYTFSEFDVETLNLPY